MKAIAPLEMVEWEKERSVKSVLISSAIQKSINNIANTAQTFVNDYV
jgi:hypothetical protein